MGGSRGPDRLEWLGWSAHWARAAASYAGYGRPGRLTGRLAAGVFGVVCAGGIVRATLGGAALARMAGDPDDAPCPGDWVVVRHGPDGPFTVEQILPRHNLVRGVDPLGRRTARPVAANVDLMAVVVPGVVGSGDPTATVRGWLAAGREAGARTAVVLVGWQGPAAPLVLDPSARREGPGPTVCGSAGAARGAPGWWAPAGETALLAGYPALCASLTRAVAPATLGRFAVVPGGGLLIDPGCP